MTDDPQSRQSSAIRDFTLDKYKALCCTLLENKYTPVTISAFLNKEIPYPEKIVLIRHDVDRKVQNALKMAKLEHSVGIRSTYYFRYPYTFKPDVIAAIYGMGHEVGYHYETLSKKCGDHQKAIALFKDELNAFRNIPVQGADPKTAATANPAKKRMCPIVTICMHGSPISRYNNCDLWKTHDFRDYGIVGEAYLSMIGYGLQYLTDTGRTWGAKHSVRDEMPGTGVIPVETTDDLTRWIGSIGAEGLYLTVHPERWALSMREWATCYVMDSVINVAKKILLMGKTI